MNNVVVESHRAILTANSYSKIKTGVVSAIEIGKVVVGTELIILERHKKGREEASRDVHVIRERARIAGDVPFLSNADISGAVDSEVCDDGDVVQFVVADVKFGVGNVSDRKANLDTGGLAAQRIKGVKAVQHIVGKRDVTTYRRSIVVSRTTKVKTVSISDRSSVERKCIGEYFNH